MTNMRCLFQSNRTVASNALKGVFALGVVCVQLAHAGTAPCMTFYVPFPEADALTALEAINANANAPITTYLSIAAVADNTIIYFDQWEDGYEKTHHLTSPIQSTTQIWGDGNPANGAPPGVPTDLINSGTVILLNNSVDPANPSALDYDARDKIVSTRVIAVTRTYWAAGSETLMAGSVETYDTSKWGTDYRVPVGQNIPDGASGNDGDHQMFAYTALSVMASEEGTTVYIDADSNGSYETTNTLNEGESVFVNGGVNVGARVTSTKPVQVMMYAGDVGSNYESRDSTLLPLSLWSNSYFTPVSTATGGTGTRVWLYNPGGTSITVNYRYRLGAATGVTTNSTTTVGANAYASVLLPDTAGAEFYTTGSPAPLFYAYSTTDSDNATTTGNQAFDWSYTLIPRQLLTPQVLVGVGMGRDPLSAVNPAENGNPIWVTTVGNGQSNATVYVDFNGDNQGSLTDSNGHHYDTNFVARELQPVKIYDPDGDQTAMLIYTLSTHVMLAAAWGQDPLTATAGEPGLDAGTAVPPVDVFDVSKSLTLVNDADADGQLGPGERVSYEINIGNTSRAPVPADVIVQDVLPEDTTYVAGSSYYRTGTNNAWVAISDDSSGTAFPLDGAGYRIYAAIPVDDFFTVRFQADVDTFGNLTPGRTSILNTGTVTAVVYNRKLPFQNETYLHGSLGDRVWNDANGNGDQDVGETGINGVIVYLDSNTNGVRDADERYATTAGNGIYLLTNALIEAGTHLVRIDLSTLASDFLQTYDIDGTNTAHAATVTLAAGQDRTDVDFGYRSPARVGDFVWVDTNLNGQQDLGEPGLPNVVVNLYTNNVLIATTTSSATGAYVFTNLLAGTYTVAFTPPVGYFFTASNVGNDASDSDPLPGTNRTAAVTLAGAQNETTIDAGFYQLASLSGAVRVDVDGDGVIDAEDTAGIAGVMISLLDSGSNVVATATTSGSGDYAFSNLTPGSYTVVQTLPSGFTNTVDVLAPNDLRIPLTLTSGQNSTGNLFYDTRTGSVTAQNKVLYLSDPSQALDRVDPVASGDTSAANTATLIPYSAGGVVVDAASSTLKALPLTALAYDASASIAANTASVTLSHTTGAGVDRLLLVGVSMRSGDQSVNSVTYNGLALTRVGEQSNGAATRMEMWQLINPPSGTYNVVATLSASGRAVVGATTFSGVDQTEPLGPFVSTTGTSAAPSVTVSSAAGEIVFDTVANAAGQTAMAPGAGQTERWDVDSGGFNAQDVRGGASTEAGAASVTMSWTAGNDDWAIGAVAVKPARVSLSHITGTGSDRLMLVGVSYEDDDRDGSAGDLSVTSVTYAGQVLTLVGTVNGTADETARIYSLLNPPSGTGTVVVAVGNPEAGDGMVVGVATFSGVDQTTPLGAFASSSGDASPASVTVASGVGEIVFDTFMLDDGDAIAGAGGGQTARWNLTQTGNVSGSGSTKAGAAPSTSMSWTFNTGVETWALGAVSVKPAIYGNPLATFTQSPAFELPFGLASGTTLLITNYVNVLSGTMPANPAITARLSADGSTFLTLSNPTYNSGNNTLVWSGSLGSTVAISPGQPLSLSVSNAQTGVEFQIRHDSSTYPSKIILPTASIIAVPSVAVYDAAYPGGTPVSTSPITSQRYVRFTVTDPFGAYDITGAGLDINGPGTAGDLNVALTDVQVVSSNAWSKTYEYVWPTIALSGSYSLTVTANEGTEGITASGATTEILYAASIGDFVWFDANNNGQQDGGETGLSNVVVRLYNTNNVVVGVTTSSVTGAYTFMNLVQGGYMVEYTPPAGYLFTTPNAGNDNTDSDPLAGTNRTAIVTLTASQDNVTVDAGFVSAASIAGFVRIDLNGNGVVESSDTNGIAGVTVQLLDAGSNVVATTTTAVNGSYSFSNLVPGTYTVRETDLGGWYSTTDVSAPNDNLIPVTLAVGQNSTGNIFHDTQRASIGDFVWNDLNGNGQQDGGAEAGGLSNVVVRLYNTNNVVVGVATSTVTGAYAFTSLAAGSYTVSFTPPANYLSTTSNVGNDATDSDPLPGTNRTAVVTLTSGEVDNTVDAGFYAAASIAGFVRIDLNGNGVAEAGDTNGIVGVTVQLLDAASNVVATATTAADGSYSFTNLRPGTYTVRETDLGGWYSTTDVSAPNDNLIPVTLAVGQNSTGNIFHDTQRASIGDFVWEDLNGDGQQDGGAEANGLSNVVVRLYNTNNVVVGVATSTVTGAYAFTSLAAGSYTVSFTPPANYLSTTSNVGNDATDSDPLPGTNRTAVVTLASGQADNSVDAGFYAAASIAGFVRIDLNGNGVAEAGDTNGIAGVTVELLDVASNVVATATTAADGSYSFTNLRPGTYTVRETDLGGWYSTLDATAPNDNLIPVTLAVGQNSTGNIFHDTQRATIGDFVWEDLNGDGQQDGGAEAGGLSNVVVRLYDSGGSVVGVATSTVTGAYAFTSLVAGSYTVSFTPPANYLSTTSNVGNDATDSDPLPGTNRTAVVTLASGQADNSVDAGFYAAASIAGFVRIDLNGNGVAEAGDTNGISGVTVELLDAVSNVVATATTAADGSYSFTNLRPGAYTVRETDLGGWYSTLDATAPNDNLIPVTLAVGQNSTGNIFHDTQRATIGDFVWEDLNGDGQQDGGAEAGGLSNVVVRLYDSGGSVVGVVTSTVTGAFAFTNLAAGSYTVSFSPPANYFSTTSNVGSDATDSDPLAGTNRTATVTLASGQIDNSVDAGFYAAASIAGFVRIDLNGNGVAEAGDTNGIAGVTVELLDAASNVVATATTAADGSYSFTNLRPGAYTVRETDLGGWYSTLDATAPNDNLIPVTLAVGQNSTGNIFHDTQRATIGDFVWEDLNGDGQQDGGAEAGGLSNVVVRLYDSGGSVVGVATSTVTGAYAFTSLAAGSYTVSFTPPANYLSTTSNVGSDATDSDPLPGTNRTAVVTLASGQADNSVDAGFYAAASIAGFVRIDLNGNGVAEAGDTNGIAGVTVELLDVASNVVATASTAADGSYGFVNLHPGSYTVRESDLGGWYSTTDVSAPNDNLIPVTLSIGQNSVGNIFHDTQRATIGDFVWEDLNGDGQQDGGAEAGGLSNVVVRLYDSGGSVVGVATSAVTGAYAFTSLAAGSYTVSFIAPANYLSTTSNVGSDATDSDPLAGTNRTAVVTLTSGQVDNSVDAGFYAAASIAGFARIDLNGNGVAEAGDTNGIAGVTVELLDAASNVVATATTAADGSYSFTNLRPGTYTVRETDLGGWYSTLDATAPNDNLIPVTLAIGQNSVGNIFHDTQRATIGDFVWEDLNGNGQQDGGEPGFSNVVVRLHDVNSIVLETATSDVSGAYAFSNLLTGSYTVSFTPPANYLCTTSNVGNDATDSDPLPGTNRTATVTLASGQIDNSVDAGFYAAASIAGFVRIDLNGNGVAEAGDTNGIVGVTVELLDAASNLVATASTAADGSYSFTSLRPGTYTVRETDLGGWYSTLDITAPNDNLIPVTLAVGQDSTGNNFDDAQPASLGDRVWNDLDGDGAQEAFEPGIANVRVYLDSNGSGAYNAGEPMATTAADGSYQISSLLAGSYTARVDVATLPAAMIQTYDLNGALDNSALVTLNSNQTRDDVDFGYRATAVYAIRGQVRDDYDLNGMFSDPDLPVAGVEVTLYTDPNGDGDPADGAAIVSTRTVSDGSYVFNNLLSGAYVVVETDPVYSVSTADKVDANDNRIPVLIVNADVLERDFLDAVDPSGYLYDVADGRIVPGGSVSVAGPGSYVLMDGSNGQYMFIATNNAPGTYTISVTPPPDYVLDLTRPAQAGSFDPTGGPDPTVLGSYESVTPQGFLVNYSAASNTYYYTFDLQPGDPPVINNNFPLKKIVLEVTGTVYYDLNRLTDNTVNGVGTDAGGLFANLVDPTTYMVIACVPVATNGTYRFTEAEGVLADTSYVVILTQTVQPVASVLTGATLPANWVSTGDHVGAGPGSDGMPDSWLQASTTADGVREVNFGIVSVPDITPVITATPNVMTGVTDYEIYVQCIELKGINTTGLITLRIPKDPRWVMLPGWNPSFTQLPVSGLPVQNPLWTHTEDADTHFFTTTSTITGSTQATFGFQARWNAGQTRGSYTISVAIVPGSGGEDRINNNNDSETVNYSF